MGRSPILGQTLQRSRWVENAVPGGIKRTADAVALAVAGSPRILMGFHTVAQGWSAPAGLPWVRGSDPLQESVACGRENPVPPPCRGCARFGNTAGKAMARLRTISVQRPPQGLRLASLVPRKSGATATSLVGGLCVAGLLNGNPMMLNQMEPPGAFAVIKL